jgi:hypothetical protein
MSAIKVMGSREADEIDPPIHIISRAKPTFADLARDLDQVERLGKWIAKSKFFNLDYEEQGFIIASECYLSGVTILEYAKRNKIVNGKPFSQYDAILAAFRERGGDHKFISKSPDLVAIEFTKANGDKSTHSLSWEDAQQEPYPYLGKEADIVAKLKRGETPELKPKYATPGSRETMLIARLVSKTIRAICPEINYGLYVEEESDDFQTVTVPSREVNPALAPRQSRYAPEAAPALALPAPSIPETVPVSETPVVLAISPEPSPAIGSIHDPLTDEQATRIRQLLTETKQAGDAAIADKVKAKLKASGLEKLADMTIAEGNVLIEALTIKSFSLWMDASLKGHKSPS